MNKFFAVFTAFVFAFVTFASFIALTDMNRQSHVCLASVTQAVPCPGSGLNFHFSGLQILSNAVISMTILFVVALVGGLGHLFFSLHHFFIRERSKFYAWRHQSKNLDEFVKTRLAVYLNAWRLTRNSL